MARLVVLLAIAGCTKAAPPPPAASCAAFVEKQLETAYAGAVSGAAQVKYVRDEWAAKYREAALEDCQHFDASYVACMATTGAASCADPLSEAARRQVFTELAADGLAAGLAATTAPASADECGEVATRMAMVLQSAATDATRPKIPSADGIAALCTRDRWSAFYVRCTNAGDRQCTAEKPVMAGMKALILSGGTP
jgi:hypothetical protein